MPCRSPYLYWNTTSSDLHQMNFLTDERLISNGTACVSESVSEGRSWCLCGEGAVGMQRPYARVRVRGEHANVIKPFDMCDRTIVCITSIAILCNTPR